MYGDLRRSQDLLASTRGLLGLAMVIPQWQSAQNTGAVHGFRLTSRVGGFIPDVEVQVIPALGEAANL